MRVLEGTVFGTSCRAVNLPASLVHTKLREALWLQKSHRGNRWIRMFCWANNRKYHSPVLVFRAAIFATAFTSPEIIEISQWLLFSFHVGLYCVCGRNFVVQIAVVVFRTFTCCR